MEVDSLVVDGEWKALLSGKLIASVRVDSPRLFLNFNGIHHANTGPQSGSHQGPAKQQTWQEKMRQLPPFKVVSAVLTNGEIHLVGVPAETNAKLAIEQLNLRAENITNSADLAPTSMARLAANARILAAGKLQLTGQAYPLAEAPTFNADLSSSDIDLTELRAVIRQLAGIEVRAGVVGLYLEAAATNGRVRGYAKPVFDHLELEPPKQIGFVAHSKAWAAKALAWLGRNKRKDRIATRLDFEGALDNPAFNFTDSVVSFIRNAFSTAERASVEHRIWFSRAGKTPDEVTIADTSRQRTRSAVVIALLKETFSRWSEDSVPRMAAALSYYTAFSMAPLLILVISIAGLALGRDVAQAKIVEQIAGLVGPRSAAAIQDMLHSANRPAKGVVFSIIGIVSLIAGATGVLSELKSALNTIWRTREPGNVKEIIKKNVQFVGMLLGIGFLLTVSLVLSAALATVGKFLSGLLPASEIILHVIDFVVSAGIIAVLFAAMYRFLPNSRVEWRNVWMGAVVTSLLFNLGKIGLGLYIGKSAAASSYGAAGAILVVLLWVYYSGLIFYSGAEFTKLYADRYG
ncbi:MAG: YihY family inner membrane protein [Deltaproteobacteria bacterium]|nr:YihY family inner membrane protein [Deltaproteobacteria bacterium]